MNKRLLALFIAAGLTVTGFAIAEGHKDNHMMPDLMQADQNGDGAVSKDEMVAFMQSRNAEKMEMRMDQMMSMMDADEDGLITQAEMDAMKGTMKGRKGEKCHGKDGHGKKHNKEHGKYN